MKLFTVGFGGFLTKKGKKGLKTGLKCAESRHQVHALFARPRIVRNCTEPEARDRRLKELKEMLTARDYKPNIINDCIRKAQAMPRNETLKDIIKEVGTPRPVFVVLYDPRMPSAEDVRCAFLFWK